MNIQRPPEIHIDLSDIPADPKERHELLVSIFGRYIMWLRNWAVGASRQLIESQEGRESLGTIRKAKYDLIAKLDSLQREAACKFAEATVDRFAQLFLTLLSGTGVDQRLGANHAIRFKLDAEIIEVETEEVVDHETINRAGEKAFADYWGQWLNQSK